MPVLAPFAAVEALINRGFEAMLTNAVATFAGGEPFSVAFDTRPVSFEGMVEAVGPAASFALAKAPGLALDSVLQINGQPYVVVGGLTPDASGWVTVQLDKR
ncbi:MAG: hypothetical protein EOO29_08390 [Comamonadaceae bacterium]|nr:MAG: hypothetical protein EOO29_08390 [Comamonadaceae bacterium]